MPRCLRDLRLQVFSPEETSKLEGGGNAASLPSCPSLSSEIERDVTERSTYRTSGLCLARLILLADLVDRARLEANTPTHAENFQTDSFPVHVKDERESRDPARLLLAGQQHGRRCGSFHTLLIVRRPRATSKSRRYGVRELAPAFWAGSLLPAESAPASRRAESGSKLPHSKFARIAIIPLSYSCGTLTYPWHRPRQYCLWMESIDTMCGFGIDSQRDRGWSSNARLG